MEGEDSSEKPDLWFASALALARRQVDTAAMLHWAPVALGLGIGVYFALPAEPPLGLTVGALLLLLLARAAISDSRSVASMLFLGVSLAVGGMGLAQIRTMTVAGPVIERETRPVTLSGQIIRVERRAPGNQRLLIAVEAISGLAQEELPVRVRVTVRTKGPELFPGDRVSLRAILTPPPEPVLPGGFDFARSAWFQQIGALGFAISSVERLRERPAQSFEIRVEGLRDAVAQRVSGVIPGEAGDLAVALITGLRSGLSEDVRDDMRGAGLAHLLAISGLHMALVTGALFFGLRALLALSPVLALKYPIKKIAALVAWTGAVFYLLLSGAGISTQRAFIMVSIVLLAVLLERRAISMRLVALAALVVLVLTPEALLSASFQMSFAAVVGLVAGFEWHQQRFGATVAAGRGLARRAAWYLWGIILATLIAEVTIGPVAAFHFHRVTLYGIPANIVAMPLMSMWIMPLAVLALVLMPLGLEAVALVPMGWGLEALIAVANTVANLPGAVRPIPAMPFASFLLIIAGGLWLALVRRAVLRRLAVVPLLLAIVPAVLSTRPDVLIGREGKIFAVTDRAGDYSISTRRAGRFTRKSWLETYGQREYQVWPTGKAAGKAAGKGGDPDIPVRCDPVACVYALPGAPGGNIAFVTKREGFAEECLRAQVLVSVHFAPRDCTGSSPGVDGSSPGVDGSSPGVDGSSPGVDGPMLVIDGRVMRRAGAITLSRVDDRWRMESAAETRGARPWTR